METKPDTILIFTSDTLASESKNEVTRSRGINNIIMNSSQKLAEVTVKTMQDNMCQFIKNLDTIMASSPKEVGGLTLDEIEIHANIDSKGNISIAGIISAEMAIQGGIKFILRKKINQ